MSNIVRIKRRLTGGAGAPASLQNAELAYNEVDNILYYGQGTGGAGGSATAILAIAGVGAYVALTGTQTIAGVKTFSSTISGSIDGNAGTATKLATARTIAFTGDATASGSFDGSANYSQALTLAASGVTAGTYTKVTVDSKGRVTAGATVSYSDLSAPTAAISWGGFALTNLADPTNAQDAATKNYVDSVAQGLDVKASVKCATTASITLSGTQTIDGITVAAGDRVLVKNQATPAQNGIYVASASAWTRSTDMDAWTEFVSAFTFVEQGTVNSDTGWTCTVDAGGTLGTTAVTFVQFSGAGTYLAGNGLNLTGSTFAVVANGSTINVSSSGIKVSDTYAGNTSLSTLGTVTSGTWNATAIGVNYGGLGLTSALTGLIIGNGSSYSAAVAGTDYLSPSSTIDGGTF